VTPHMNDTVSVLMAVYGGTDPVAFEEALRSVRDQTRAPDEVVLVVDGPVGTAHEVVLARAALDLPGLRRVDLPANVGLGTALARGLAECTGTWIARADADDVNEPERFAAQLRAVHAGAEVCGAAMTEMVGGSVQGVRRMPTDHHAIARRMRTRNPINHPTAFFRRAAALDAGGYQELPFLEDYDLWARMLVSGARFMNLPEALVRFRADGMLDRRSGPEVRRAERELQCRLRRYGLVSAGRGWWNLVIRNVFRALPRPLMKRAYAVLFHVRGGRQP